MKETKNVKARMHTNSKTGISLIVLVITIIVMIILAATVIISLSNNGIIGKANEAVEQTNLKQVQTIATTIWLESKLTNDDPSTVRDKIIAAIGGKSVASKYNIEVTNTGVTVTLKGNDEGEEETPGTGDDEESSKPEQLAAPTIAITSDTLTITENEANGSYTGSYEIYVGTEKKATIEAGTIVYDLTTLNLEAGTYSITVKAVATDTDVQTSEASEAVQYTVEEESNVPVAWQAYVSEVTSEGVPIPKGFMASPFSDEDQIAEGLVIYEIDGTETANPSSENQHTWQTTKNQFVWIPVDKTTFATSSTQFKRTDYINSTSKVVTDSLGTSSKYWELILTATNMPAETQNDSYVSPATLLEATAMYESVAEYGGFYIGRYEAGGSSIDATTKFGRGTLSITMGKYPYNGIKWGTSMSNEVLEGGAVTLARSLYTNDNTNYGVVSTLTYGVQWDRTLDWIKSIKGDSFSLTSSSENGNYSDTTLSASAFNQDAKYVTATFNVSSSTTGYYDIGTWTLGTSFTTRPSGTNYIMTTGALIKANLCNVYDMAGNMFEWTMEGRSTDTRVYRGGVFYYTGSDYPVSFRDFNIPAVVYAYCGFRPSLYIKSSTGT